MPTDTPPLAFEGPLANVPDQLLEASRSAVTASAELYADSLRTVAQLQRSLAQGTPLEPLSDVFAYQADAARELVRAYVATGEQAQRRTRESAEIADEAAARVAKGTARATRKATKRTTRAVRKAPVKRAPKPAEPPLPDYASLTADELIAKLPELSQATLAQVAAYEQANAARSTVLDRVAALTGPEPAPGYDELTVEDIQKLLSGGDDALATAVRDYERRHKGRSGVLEAAERQTEGS